MSKTGSITANKINMPYTVTAGYKYVFSDGTTFTLTQDTVPTKAQILAGYIKAAMTNVPPVSPTNPITPTNGSFTVDGAKNQYPANGIIKIAPGIYKGDITLHNLSNTTVDGTGVIIDGFALHLGNLNNVTVKGFTIQNTKGKFLYFDSRLVNTVISGLTGLNCTDGLQVGYKVNWDGTDATVQLLNLTLANCIFNNVGTIYLDGNVWSGPVVNMVKGLEVSGCQWLNSNAGNMLDSRAIDGFKIHDNNFANINVSNRDVDTRLIMMCGNGDAYNNTFTETCGHSIAINPLSFSKSVRAKFSFYKNVTNHTYKYSQYEVQQFAEQLTGQTQACDGSIDSSVSKDINTDHYDFNGAVVDNYVGSNPAIKDACILSLTNCTLQNAYQKTAPPISFWNGPAPAKSSGNVYIP